MHSKRLLCELQIKGSSYAQIARELGFCRSYVSHVARGTPNFLSKDFGKSKKIEEAISQKIDRPLWEIFPDRYVSPGSLPPGAFNKSENFIPRIASRLSYA